MISDSEKLDRILTLLEGMDPMVRAIKGHVDNVTSEEYIGKERLTDFSINIAADILVEALSPEIKDLVINILKRKG